MLFKNHTQLLLIKDWVKVKSNNVYNGRAEHVLIICMCTVEAHNAYQKSYVILSLTVSAIPSRPNLRPHDINKQQLSKLSKYPFKSHFNNVKM